MIVGTEWWEWMLFGMPWQLAAVIAVIGVIILATFGKDDH